MPVSPLRRRLAVAAAPLLAALVLSSCAAATNDAGDDGGEVVWAIEGANLSAEAIGAIRSFLAIENAPDLGRLEMVLSY